MHGRTKSVDAYPWDRLLRVAKTEPHAASSPPKLATCESVLDGGRFHRALCSWSCAVVRPRAA